MPPTLSLLKRPSTPTLRFLECLRVHSATISLLAILRTMSTMAAMGFLAMAIPCTILIKYEMRLAGLSAAKEDAGASEEAEQDRVGCPLPFEEAFGSLSVRVLEALRLPPPLRTFAHSMHWIAERMCESLVLRAICIPIATYYSIWALTSRFSQEGKVRETSMILF